MPRPLFAFVAFVLAGCTAIPAEDPAPNTERAEDELSAVRTIVDRETGTEYRVNENRRVVFQSDRPALARRPEDGLGTTTSAINASGTMTTWDGRNSVQIVECTSTTSGGKLSAGCSVGPDYVLVGGGAEDTWMYTSGSPGALLTESRPQDADDYSDGRTWLASSKDHVYPATRSLHVWAIGLRLKKTDGTWLPRSELKRHMNYNTKTSSPSLAPTATCSQIETSMGYDVIGGGARANGNHQLLTSSQFTKVGIYTGGWTASAKAHIYAENANVTAYCISLYRIIEKVGSIDTWAATTSHTTSAGWDYVEAGMTSGYVPTCYGGSSTYNGAGRMLYRLSPADNTITKGVAGSKDHGYYDGGTTTVNLMLFKLR